mgnify:CR=1 FL=1
MNEQEKYQKLWEERVKDYENSDLTMKVWCEANHVKTHQLHYWRKKFKTNKENIQSNLVKVDLNQKQKQTIDESSIQLQVGSLSINVKSGFKPSLLKDVKLC